MRKDILTIINTAAKDNTYWKWRNLLKREITILRYVLRRHLMEYSYNGNVTASICLLFLDEIEILLQLWQLELMEYSFPRRKCVCVLHNIVF